MKQRKFTLSAEAVVQFEKREHETREALELRRLQAVRLYGSGADIAVVQQVSRQLLSPVLGHRSLPCRCSLCTFRASFLRRALPQPTSRESQ